MSPCPASDLTSPPCGCAPLQLRKPVSTLSIPGAMRCSAGATAGLKEGEDPGIALVGVHSEYPRYTDERKLPKQQKPSVGYR